MPSCGSSTRRWLPSPRSHDVDDGLSPSGGRDDCGASGEPIERPPRRRRFARAALCHHLSRPRLHLGGGTAHAGRPGHRSDRLGLGDGHVHPGLLPVRDPHRHGGRPICGKAATAENLPGEWGPGLDSRGSVTPQTRRMFTIVFILHFETGGTVLDFDSLRMRAHFEREFAATR